MLRLQYKLLLSPIEISVSYFVDNDKWGCVKILYWVICSLSRQTQINTTVQSILKVQLDDKCKYSCSTIYSRFKGHVCNIHINCLKQL
jgi:hypothetical protein